MHILVYKLKDSSLGKLVGFLLLFALTVPLVTHYYLGKHAQPSETTLVSFQTRTKLDKSVDQVDLLLDKIENLQDQVKELQRIKLSLSNELRELEGKKNKLQGDIHDFSSKADNTKIQVERFHADISLAQRELEQIKLAKIKAKDCPELPNLKVPQRLTATTLLSENEAYVDEGMASHCTLDRCFDFSRCSFTSGFPVFVYKQAVGHISSDVVLMQELLKESPYYTSEPEKACLYVILIGSLEQAEPRKRISELGLELHSMPYWSGNGRNHLLLYIRSTSRFSKNSLSLEIDSDLALIAQSTFSGKSIYRHGFDVVVPPVNGPLKEDVWNLSTLQLPAKRKYLLSFQGEHRKDLSESMSSVKEQLLNISAESRDVFVHLSLSSSHKTVGDEWLLYGNHDQRKEILKQSTFSLVISSNNAATSWDSTHVRLLEALQCGAIPLVLSSGVVLPFDDMIDWRKAAVLLAPSRITELNVLLRTVTNNDVLEMRRQGRFLWETYLSTTKAIFETTLATIRTRLSIPAHPVLASPSPLVFTNPPVTSLPDPEAVIHLPQESPTFIRNLTDTVVDAYNTWNTPPGAFRMYPSSPFFPVLPSSAPFRNSSKGFELIGAGMGGAGEEFSKALGGNHPAEQFTIVILTYQRELVLMESIQRLVGLHYLNKVVVVWNSPELPSLSLRWPNIGVPVHVVKVTKNSLNNRFIPFDAIETDAVFSIDDDVEMRHDEILLAFRVWREARDRIVGFPARFHAWDSQNHQWLYSSEYTCELSMILTGAAFFHKYYSFLYTHWMPQAIRDKVDEYMNCEDIAMNFLVSHVTRKPPIKVTSRWTFTCPNCPVSLWSDNSHFEERSKCINFFVDVYGYMPLLRSQFRADSILFKTRIPSEKTKCFKYV